MVLNLCIIYGEYTLAVIFFIFINFIEDREENNEGNKIVERGTKLKARGKLQSFGEKGRGGGQERH